MKIQRALLRLMLLVMAATAVLGILRAGSASPIGPNSNEFTVQIISTLVMAALCSGLVIWIGKWLRYPQLHPAVLLAIITIGVGFIMTDILIWQIPRALGVDPEPWIALDYSLVVTILPSSYFLSQFHKRSMRVASALGILLSAAVLLLWIIPIAFWPRFQSFHYWEYGYSLAAMGLLAVLALIGVGSDQRHWRWLGVVAAAWAYVLFIRLPRDIYGITWSEEPIGGLITLAVLVAHANLALQSPVRNSYRWLVYCTITVAVVTGVLLNYAWLLEDPYNIQRVWIMFRWVPAGMILWTLGIFALVIIGRLGVRPVASAEVTVICPVCGRQQSFPAGSKTCDGCGAKIQVTVETSGRPFLPAHPSL